MVSQNSQSRGKSQHCGSKRGKLDSLRDNQSVLCSFPRCADSHQRLVTSCQTQTPPSPRAKPFCCSGIIKSWNHSRVWAERTSKGHLSLDPVPQQTSRHFYQELCPFGIIILEFWGCFPAIRLLFLRPHSPSTPNDIF